MKTEFSGFPPDAIEFFRGLKKHNDRDWFQARKQVFEESVKAPMAELVSALNAALMKFAPEYVTEPKHAIYRFYRDTRFSADKSPYKDRIAASFWRRGMEKHTSAGYYFSVSDSAVEFAGGVYMPGPEELLTIRKHLAEHHQEFRKLAGARALKALAGIQGEQLSRVPKGFPADHPAADLLRFKQLYVYGSVDPALATASELFPALVERFRAMTPFLGFLNKPLIEQRRRSKAAALLV